MLRYFFRAPARGRIFTNIHIPCHRAICHGQQVASWHRACSLGPTGHCPWCGRNEEKWKLPNLFSI